MLSIEASYNYDKLTIDTGHELSIGLLNWVLQITTTISQQETRKRKTTPSSTDVLFSCIRSNHREIICYALGRKFA